MNTLIALCGSTRLGSTNALFIQAIETETADWAHWLHQPKLDALPHFNPDLDGADIHPAVAEFRSALAQADGVLICTPEYAAGIPGTLKNALDWLVSTPILNHKPVLAITATSLGTHAHASLLATLGMVEANLPQDCQLLIAQSRTKINAEAHITDPDTLQQIRKAIRAWKSICNAEKPTH